MPRPPLRSALAATRMALAADLVATEAALHQAHAVLALRQLSCDDERAALTEAEAAAPRVAALARDGLGVQRELDHVLRLAEFADRQASGTTAAAAASAAAAKAAGLAVVAVARDCSAVFAISQTALNGEPVDRAAWAAHDAAVKAAHAVEAFQALALASQLRAAQSGAGLAAETARRTRDAAARLCAALDTASARATELLAATRGRHAAAGSALAQCSTEAVSAQALAEGLAVTLLALPALPTGPAEPTEPAAVPLERLRAEHLAAQHSQALAQACSVVLSERATSHQARSAATAEASREAEAGLSAAQALLDALDHAAGAATDADDSAAATLAEGEAEVRQGFICAERLGETLDAIDGLAHALRRGQGRNELIPESVVTGAAGAQGDAAAALAAFTAALQHTLRAHAAAGQCRAAAAALVASTALVQSALAGSPDPATAASGTAASGTASLPAQLQQQAQDAMQCAAAQAQAARQAEADSAAARESLVRATAAAKTAAAVQAAAETAM